MGPRTGVDDMKRRKILPLPGLKLQPSLSSRIQSLYRLSYRGSQREKEVSGRREN
jgi:hypothetical protein